MCVGGGKANGKELLQDKNRGGSRGGPHGELTRRCLPFGLASRDVVRVHQLFPSSVGSARPQGGAGVGCGRCPPNFKHTTPGNIGPHLGLRQRRG